MQMYVPTFARSPDEAAGANGSGDDAADTGQDAPAAVVAAVAQPASDDKFRGLTDKNRQLLDEVKKAKSELAAIRDEFGGEEGLDEIREFKKRAAESEEVALVKEGKIDALRERWLKQAKRDYERKVSSLQQMVQEREQSLTSVRSRLQRERIGNAIRSAAGRMKNFAETAGDDAVLVAMQIFSLDEDDNIVGKDESGAVMYGRDGKPITPLEWLEMQQDQRPHWFYVEGGTGMRAAGSSGRSVTYSREKARKDPVSYVAARREAEKAGKEVVLID